MHEINVLANWTILAVKLVSIILLLQGGYPDLNRKLTVPHTVVLPIELYLPIFKFMLEWFEHSIVNTKNLWLTY